MIKNYIKIAWRNLVKGRFYSVVNIGGLAIGILFTLLIGGYVWNELRVNSDLKNADRQYIIQSKWKDPNQGNVITTFGQLAQSLKENYPHLVENYYRFDGVSSNVSKGDKSFREELQLGDTTMWSMYGFSLLHGNSHTALKDPFTVVITSDKAIKYFGRENVIGETITIENFSGAKHDFMITGIMERPSKNSVTELLNEHSNSFFISAQYSDFFNRNMAWANPFIASYVQLAPGVQAKDLDEPMKKLIAEHAPPQAAENITAYLVPMKEYYLTNNNGEVKKMLYTLSAIAFFLLLMAVINFVNMSISRSANRMREIGIRKVMGGMKKQIVFQFLVESILLVFFATLIAILLYLPARDIFENILGNAVPAISQFPVYFIGVVLLLVLTVGFITGLYPAFILSSMRSAESLKGRLSAAKDTIWLRKSLVGFQFSTAAIVFIGAIIVSQQTRLFFGKSLGYDKEYVLAAQLPRDWSPAGVDRMENIRSKFAAMPEVAGITLSYEIPNGNNSGTYSIYKSGGDSTHAIASQVLMTDEYYASTYNIPMLAGIFYSNAGAYLDSTKIVINEAQAKALGWNNPVDALGQQVEFVRNAPLTIAGITKDFHFGSMQQAIPPITFLHVSTTNTFRFFSIKLKQKDNIAASIAAIQHQWASLMPGTPFEYKFIDDSLEKVYHSELKLKKAAFAATILSVLIVLLGIVGLVSLSIHQRTREMGIRKVLGASVPGIISLFLKDFLVVMLVATVLACPVIYFIMQQWLNDYVYRVSITVAPFAVALGVLLVVTILLIFLQTIKAGLSNPVKSLRTE